MDVMRKTYRELTPAEKENLENVKMLGEQFFNYLNAYVAPSRERALALTKIEEAVMWATKGLTK